MFRLLPNAVANTCGSCVPLFFVDFFHQGQKTIRRRLHHFGSLLNFSCLRETQPREKVNAECQRQQSRTVEFAH